jgi:hypothetical protein
MYHDVIHPLTRAIANSSCYKETRVVIRRLNNVQCSDVVSQPDLRSSFDESLFLRFLVLTISRFLTMDQF